MAEIRNYARPTNLYRYRSIDEHAFDRELSAIENREIYCGSYENLNDPMEGGHRLSKLLSKSKSKRNSPAELQGYISDVGIASFSETWNHETMWAHYADNFRGICIEYSFTKLMSGLPDQLVFSRMNYSDKPPLLLKRNSDVASRARQALSYKTLQWTSEREWRLFANSVGVQRYRRLNTVKRIFVGSRIRSQSLSALFDRLKRVGIPIYTITVSEYRIGSRLVTEAEI